MNVSVHTLDLTRNSMIIYIYSEFAEIVCDIGIIVLPYKFRLFCCSYQSMYIPSSLFLFNRAELTFIPKQTAYKAIQLCLSFFFAHYHSHAY